MFRGKTIQEKLFLTAFILWMMSTTISLTTIPDAFPFAVMIRRITQNLAIAIIIVKCLMGRYSSRAILTILIATPLITYSAYKSGNVRYLTLWFFVVGMQDVDPEDTIRATYKFLNYLIPFVIVLRLLGVIPDHSSIFGSFSERFGIERMALGFAHPNGLGMKFVELSACYCYLNREKLTARVYTVTIFIALLTYLIPNSLGSFAAILLVLFVTTLYRLKILGGAHSIKRTAYGYSIGSLFFNLYSVVVGILGVNIHPLVASIDNFASNRLSLSHMVFDYYGFGPFGQRINVGRGDDVDFTFLDNAYVDLLIRQGLIVYIIITILIIVTVFKMSSSDTYYGAMLLIYALLGVTTNGAFNIASNPFILAAGFTLYGFKSTRQTSANNRRYENAFLEKNV